MNVAIMKERTRKWHESQCPYCLFMMECKEGETCFATIGRTKQDAFAFKGSTMGTCCYYENEQEHIMKLRRRNG